MVNPLEDADWDIRLKICPSTTFFHSAAWAEVLWSAYGYRPVYFIQRDGGRLISLLPMIEVQSWLTGRRGISLPFTDEVDPIGLKPDEYQNLFRQVVEYGKLRNWKYIECRGGKKLEPGSPVSTSFYGHRLHLNGDHEEALFSQLESSTRRAIRKANSVGLNVEISQDAKAINTFYRLMSMTRKRHGLPPQPLSFFQKIRSHVFTRNQGMVVLVRQNQEPVAAAIFVHFGSNAIYKYGASNHHFKHLQANSLVMWTAIKWYARQGFKQLDFGRTSIGNEGLRSYKQGWGTEEYRIEYSKYDLRKNGFVTEIDGASGWYNRLFQVMPSPISHCVGGFLYKHVA